MEIDQKAELGETKEESLARHDRHFLHLLGQATAAFQSDSEQIEYSEPTPYYLKQGKRDLRFSIGFRDELSDEKSYIQIGVGQITTTGLFLTGCSVIQFFAFYPYKRDDKLGTDHLYNSSLYIYRRPWFGDKSPGRCLVPFKKTLWQRFVKGFNDLFCIKGSTSVLRYFGDHDKQNPEITKALTEAVFTAIQSCDKLDRAEKLMRMKLETDPNHLIKGEK